MKKYFQKIKNNKAFTLIEVMVAVGMVAVGMLGVVSLMTQNIIVQSVNKNNLVASMLAQEGLELVREIRDTNWLKLPIAISYTDGIPATSTVDIGGFRSASADLDFTKPATDIKIDTNGFYGHTGATPTIFKRLIQISTSTSDKYMRVRSTVRWVRAGEVNDYVAETLLYDWQ